MSPSVMSSSCTMERGVTPATGEHEHAHLHRHRGVLCLDERDDAVAYRCDLDARADRVAHRSQRTAAELDGLDARGASVGEPSRNDERLVIRVDRRLTRVELHA